MKTIDTRVRRAIAAIAAGRPVVVSAGAAHNNEGFLTFAAEAATPRLLAFTVRHTSGYVRAALPRAYCERLDLPPICHSDSDRFGTAAHRVAVDWSGTSTGISATDRAATIAALAAESATASDFRRPGHVVPVEAATDGVLGRPGPAEAAVDLARLAGRREAGVFCDIVSRDHPADMARGGELVEFAVEHGLAVVSIDELVAYRQRTEPQVIRLAETSLPTWAGDSRVVGFRGAYDGGEHMAVIIGEASGDEPVPLHVHVECLTGDVFGSTACRCGAELAAALTMMRTRGSGVIVYMRPHGPLRACGLFDGGSLPADLVSQTVASILRDLGVYTVRLADDVQGFGLVMFGAIREHGLRVAG